MASKNGTKLALIIGASRGLGLGLAGEYLRLGWQVIGTTRDGAPTAGLAALQASHQGALEIAALDITDAAGRMALRQQLAGRSLDLLFVNAGISNGGQADAVADLDDAAFARILHVNTLSPMRVIGALADLVAPDGVIAVMSSGLASIANNEAGAWETYRASKAALNMMMRSYAAKPEAAGRTLLCVAPGWVRTDMGGPQAMLDVPTSVSGMAAMITRQTGTPGLAFLDYQGTVVPW